MDLKPIQIILSAVILLISSTVGAIVYFTPMGYAETTRQMVVELDLKGQLSYYEQQAWEYRKNCMDMKTGTWLCTPDDRFMYDKILIEIEILKNKLGIG